MTKWTIYGKDGTAKHESLTEYSSDGKIVYQDTFEYSGKWMGECFLSVSIKSPYPIDFQIGDYIDYREERFTINYDPTVIKKARRGTYGEGFVYDSIKFNSYSNELTEIKFHDWVLSDNQLHYTSLPDFSFYCKDVDDLADRLQANTDRWCKANGFAKEDYWMFYTLKNNTIGTSDAGQSATTYDRTVQRAQDVLSSCGVSSSDTEYSKFTDSVTTQWKKIYGEGDNYNDSRDDERYDRTITASSQTVWDMMASIKSQFGLNFIIRGRNVYIGTHGVIADHLFEYGKGKGLYEIDKTADQDQLVVTKLHAYGSNENLPTRYYAELNMQAFVTVTSIYGSDDGSDPNIWPSTMVETSLKWSSSYFNYSIDERFGIEIYLVGVQCGGYQLRGRVTENPDGNVRIYVGYTGDVKRDDYNTDWDLVSNFVKAATVGSTIYFTSGAVTGAFPTANLTAGSNLPDNMAVNYLMLPGFPKYALSDRCRSKYDETTDTTNYYITNPSTEKEVLFHTESGNHTLTFSSDKYDPYIISKNASELGIKEGDIFCNEENDDNGLKKVYPTIEEMTDTDAGIGSSGTRLDAVLGADVIEDNGVWPQDKKTEVPGFNIYLPKLGFDLRQAAKNAGGSDMKISMKNGFCGGREFDVAQATEQDDGSWKLNCSRAQDTSLDLWFPYSYAASVSEVDSSMTNAYQIVKGDNYVLTGIAVADVNYVWAASVKLLRKAIHWLTKNDYTRYVYSPKIDEIYMARQDKAAKADTTGTEVSLHDTLKEGDMLLFSDEDLQLNGAVYIDQLIIKENGNNGIPTYEVTLRNEITVGSIQRLQNQVDSIKTDISSGNVAGGVSPTDVDALVKAYGAKYFLSKVKDDTSEGSPTFNNNVTVKGAVNALGEIAASLIHSETWSKEINGGSGFGIWLTDGNASNAIFDNLTVRGKWTAAVLDIMKLSYSAGNITIDGAGSTLYAVEAYTADGTLTEDTATTTPAYFRCYFRATDGDDHIDNEWHVGDYAKCQTFNLTDGTYKNAANRVYQRLVIATDSEPVSVSGTDCHYIDLANVLDLTGGDAKKINANATDSTAYKGYLEAYNDAPQAGDSVAHVGNCYDTARQGAIQLVAVGGDAPAVNIYGGINYPAQDMQQFLRIRLSPDHSYINTRYLTYTNGSHESSPYIQCGAWASGSTAYKNEIWQYDGSSWLCTADGITATPADNTTGWQRFASKGEKGDDGTNGLTYTVDVTDSVLRRNADGNIIYDHTSGMLQNSGMLLDFGGTPHYLMLGDPTADGLITFTPHVWQDGLDVSGHLSGVLRLIAADGTVLEERRSNEDAGVCTIRKGEIWSEVMSLEYTLTDDLEHGFEGKELVKATVPIVADGSTGLTYTVEASESVLRRGTDGLVIKDKTSGILATDTALINLGNDEYLLNAAPLTFTPHVWQDGKELTGRTLTGKLELISATGTVLDTIYSDTGSGACSILKELIGEDVMSVSYTLTADAEAGVSDAVLAQAAVAIVKDGEQGTSVTITAKAVKYCGGTSGTEYPADGWQDDIPTLPQGAYLWTWTHVEYSDGNATDAYSVSRIGIDGKGIQSSVVTYSLQENNVSPESITDWGTFPATLTDGWWLYTKTHIVYSDNASTDSYSVAQVGTGSYYAGCEEYYTVGASATTPPDGAATAGTYASGAAVSTTWKQERPTPTAALPYIWNFEISRDSRGNQYVTEAICIGNFARGIVSIVETYAISAYTVKGDNQIYPADITGWTDEQQDAAPTREKPYQWNRTETTYNDGSTEVHCHISAVRGSDGDNAVQYVIEAENPVIDAAAGGGRATVTVYKIDGAERTPATLAFEDGGVHICVNGISTSATYNPTSVYVTKGTESVITVVDYSGNVLATKTLSTVSNGKDGVVYSLDPAAIIITERAGGLTSEDDEDGNTNYTATELTYDLPKTFRILRNGVPVQPDIAADTYTQPTVNGTAVNVISGAITKQDDGYRIDTANISLSVLKANATVDACSHVLTIRDAVLGSVQLTVPILFNRLGTIETEIAGDTTATVRSKTEAYIDENAVKVSEFETKLKESAMGVDYEATKNGLKTAGVIIDGDNSRIELDASTVEVKNGSTTAALFENGKIKAGLIDAENLTAGNIKTKNETVTESDGTTHGTGHTETEGGMMKVYDPDGNLQIEFGYDKELGYMVMRYYDTDGTLLYDLGPTGMNARNITQASFTERAAEAVTAKQKTFTNAKTNTQYTLYTADDSMFTGDTVSVSGKLYKYTAAKIGTKTAPDSSYGRSLTAAQAAEADGKHFASLAKLNAVEYISGGVYIIGGSTISDSTPPVSNYSGSWPNRSAAALVFYGSGLALETLIYSESVSVWSNGMKQIDTTITT